MVFNLVIPNPKNITVKDIIIKELSVNKGLTILKLLNSCKKNNLNVSYHAVYQAVNELKKQHVLEKNEKEYSITKEYVNSLKDFSKVLEENQSGKINLSLQQNSTKHFTFNSLNEATLFMAKAAYSNIFDVIKNRSIYVIFQHLWLIQTIRGVKYMDLVKKVSKLNKWYFLVQGNSLVDKKCKKAYESMFGAKIKLGLKCAPLGNLLVCGDIVIESFIPKRLIELTEKVFNNCKNKFDLNWIEQYTRLCYLDKYKITVTMTRNKQMAEQIRENVLAHF